MNSFANELQNSADAQEWIRNCRTTIYDKDQMGDATEVLTQSESSNGHNPSSTTKNWDVFSSHKGFIAAASASRMGVHFGSNRSDPMLGDSSTLVADVRRRCLKRNRVSADGMFAFLETQLGMDQYLWKYHF